MTEYAEVLFDEKQGPDGSLGIITLNRPQVLNSLNHTMIHAITARLRQWANEAHIKAVIIRAAEGRAFCAGGDLRYTYDKAKSHADTVTDFFRDEYYLNRCIHHYPKPYIALLDGITMGGGVGISIHGSHRVVTEKLMFAMPETGIGFFPDVGGSYFLPRLEGMWGYYLGLTGARINADESMAIGLMNYKVESSSLEKLLDALAAKVFNGNPNDAVDEVLDEFATLSTPSTPLLKEQATINECFNGETIEEILASLEKIDSEFAVKTIETIKQKSPMSLKVSLKAMLQGSKLDFDECMKQEFRIATHFLHDHDFIEGIRAVIIDKDQKPVWQPATLSAVKNEAVDAYFATIEEENTGQITF